MLASSAALANSKVKIMKAPTSLRWSVVALFALAALACDGDKPPANLDLLPAEKKAVASEDSEERRLRRMQLITAIDATGAQVELDVNQLDEPLYESCNTWADACNQVLQPDGTLDFSCSTACWSVANMCAAETLLALTRPQGAMIKLGEYSVPEQSEPAKQSLGQRGMTFALRARDQFRYMLGGFGKIADGSGRDEYTCADGSLSFRGASLASYAGAGLARSLEIYKQLGDAYVVASVNSADAELNSSPSVAEAAKRALTQRLNAARQLGGEVYELPSDVAPSGAFCTRAPATPSVRAAIAVIRDAAPDPADLLKSEAQLSTQNLIDGVGSACPGGSVRQRLAEFYWGKLDTTMPLPVLPNGKTVASQYNLEPSTFVEARAYLQEEFTSFARSKSAKLAKRKKPDGTLATYDSFAGTGTPPSRLPAAYYGALVRRFNDLQYNRLGHDLQFYPGEPLAVNAGRFNGAWPTFFASARNVINAKYGTPGNTLDDAAVGPLGLVAASDEYQGFVSASIVLLEGSSGFERLRQVGVYGYAAADGIKLATSEDDLRCAVTGTIEGAPCSLTNRLAAFAALPSLDPDGVYEKYAQVRLGLDKGRIYLLKPRTPLPATVADAQATLSPGSYEALIGLDVTEDPEDPWRGGGFPIIRDNENRIAALLEPSRDWCARPRTSCNGHSFDERIALEDELTDDGNGFESSWRHYLDLAKAAAAEADQLGVEYISESLASAENASGNERAAEQQREQANSHLQNLQRLCGFTSDTQTLLKTLTDPATGNLIGTLGPECGEGNPSCNPGYLCKGQPGTCTLDIDMYLQQNEQDPDIRRIKDCLSDGGVIPAVSLGDVPLCLWRDASNPNLVCKDANGRDAANGVCPQILDTSKVTGIDGTDYGARNDKTRMAVETACAAQLAATKIPSAQSGVPINAMPANSATYASVPLNYFNVSQDATDTAGRDWYEALRDISPEWWKAPSGDTAVVLDKHVAMPNGAQVTSGNFLDPNALADAVFGLDWEARFDGYAAIKFLGADLYSTGDAINGTAPATQTNPITMATEPASWPCGADPSTKPWRGDPSPSFNCTTTTGLEGARTQMFAALAAAKLLGPLTDAQLYDRDGDGAPYINFGVLEYDQIKSITVDEYCSDHPGLDWAIENFALIDDCKDRKFPTLNCGTFVAPGQESEKSCDGSKTLLRLNGSGVLQSTCDTGTAYTAVNGPVVEFGQSFGNLGCFHQGRLHAHDHALTDTALRGLSDAYPSAVTQKGLLSGWIADYLNGRKVLSDKVATYTWAADSARIPGGAGTSGKHALSITGADLLRGLGLIARAKSRNAPKVQIDQPPLVKTVDDLEAVAVYVEKVAASMRDGVSGLSFANVPAKVADAMRSQSATGAYSQLGGDMAQAMTAARGAVLRIKENAPLLANEVQQVGADIRALKILLRKSAIKQDISKIQLASQISNQLTSCAAAFASSASADPIQAGGGAVAAAATCANSFSQISFASALAELTSQDAVLDGELAVADFGAKFSSHSTSLQTLSTHLLEGAEDLDSALAAIETNRSLARSALMSAINAGSFQAQHQSEVTNVLANLATAKQRRYSLALENARKLSFVAKRAVEQRLAVRLADIREDYPLVDAPATWEATNCSMTGLDYSALAESIKANPNAPASFATGFIGDYVQKLQNFVESYSLQQNFHEGTDTAVVSLRDDIMNVRKACFVGAPNILYNAGQLDQSTKPGWGRENCPTQAVSGGEQSIPDCVIVAKTSDAPPFVDKLASQTTGYSLTFGASSTANSALVQGGPLPAGLFRLSWYTKETGTALGGAGAAVVRADTPVTVVEDGVVAATAPNLWNRRYKVFRVTTPQSVRVGFAKPAAGGTISVSAPMLEQLQDVPQKQALIPFVNTTGERGELLPECQDVGGSVFRSTRWNRSCVKLCPDGFADHCTAKNSKDYCYWEADFGFSQRDIQQGKVFNFSGFARGNFNYRIDSIGINFVGTTPRNCSDSEAREACYAAGFLPYSLAHVGPFYVRNYKGDDVKTPLFDGNVEHARGLASERYLTNPLSTGDASQIEQYYRREFAGRPLDGNFILRVWDEDGVDFNAIEDVQVVLNYRYWTKFD